MNNVVRFFENEDGNVICQFDNSLVPQKNSKIYLGDKLYRVDEIIYSYDGENKNCEYVLVDIVVKGLE